MRYTIDINADVGEGLGNELRLMPYLSSCNIACGGHAGTPETMRTVVGLAKQHGVKIGAHPSYPDVENFGRQKMDISCAALFLFLEAQIDALREILHDDATLHHVKPHGALYNLAAVDEKVAQVVIEVMRRFILPVKLYVPYKSVIARLAIQNNIPIMYEAFADRNYNNDLTLVSRDHNEALIEDADVMFEHVFRMISQQKVKTVLGHEMPILAQTVCIHGDHPNAVNLAMKLHENLKIKGVQIL